MAGLDQALSAIISGHPLNASDMQRVVGHLTCRMLLCRPLLSCLKSVYSYINAGVVSRRAVWPSVRNELQTIRGLLVFAFADLRSPFSTTVTMTDACLSGYGVVESFWRKEDVESICQYDERWRFRDYASEDHREEALATYDREMRDIATAVFSPISVQSKTTIAMKYLPLWRISSSRASLHVFSTRASGATFLWHHSVFGSRFTFVKLEES